MNKFFDRKKTIEKFVSSAFCLARCSEKSNRKSLFEYEYVLDLNPVNDV